MTRPARLDEQIAFLVEIDKLKSILRQTPIADGSRRENTAEHSWHLAMFAVVLAEHAPEPVDVSKVVTPSSSARRTHAAAASSSTWLPWVTQLP